MTVTRRFGFLATSLTVAGSVYEISSLATLPQSVAALNNSPRLKDGWFYPRFESASGVNPRPKFILPMSHEITLAKASPADLDADPFSEYLIATIGFLYGTVLIPDGWIHLTRVKVDPTRTHDYYLTDGARNRVLDLAVAFWQQHPNERKRMFSLMHWHCLSLAYLNDFEIFAWQYTVLDACWRLHACINSIRKKIPHAERISALAGAYKLEIPIAWDGGKELARIRNELIHEAGWGQQPLGFGSHPANLSLSSLIWFNARAILAILGESGSYVRSRPSDFGYVFE